MRVERFLFLNRGRDIPFVLKISPSDLSVNTMRVGKLCVVLKEGILVGEVWKRYKSDMRLCMDNERKGDERSFDNS
jgi:hypothetical protein